MSKKQGSGKRFSWSDFVGDIFEAVTDLLEAIFVK